MDVPYVKTSKAKALEAAKRWEVQYHRGTFPKSSGGWYDFEKYKIWENLLRLGSDPAPEQVDAVIGNDTWTHSYCSMCSQSVEIVIGVSADDEGVTELCLPCVKKVAKLARTMTQ